MKRFLRIVLPLTFLLLLTPCALAQTTTPTPAPTVTSASPIKLLPDCATSSNPKIAGNCGITDLLGVFLNLAEYLLGASGAVALGFFIYGGFTFILSRGSPEGVKKAFGILRSAAVGVAIIFLSGVIVRFTITSLTGGQSAIPTIGEPCKVSGIKPAMGVSDPNGDGIWVSVPPGLDPNNKVIPEGLVCIKLETATKPGDKCSNLNGELLDNRGLKNGDGKPLYDYTCQDPSNGQVSTCVRGLCAQMQPQGQYACCLSK